MKEKKDIDMYLLSFKIIITVSEEMYLNSILMMMLILQRIRFGRER